MSGKNRRRVSVHRLVKASASMVLAALCLCACQSGASKLSTPPATATSTTAPVTWSQLMQRPLNIPSAPPGTPCARDRGHEIHPAFSLAVGKGPVYAAGSLGESDGILEYAPPQNYHSATWGGQKTLWVIDSAYRGAVLIRGRQIDGPHEVRFDRGLDEQGKGTLEELQPALRLLGSKEDPWANYPTATRLDTPGCYAFQVDGASFSYLIYFQARPE